jgi:hypothetical protein
MGCGAGIAGGLLNAGNVGRDFTGAESRLLIWAVGGAGALVLDRRPFPKSCRRIKVDVILVVHIGLQTHLSLLVQVADEVMKYRKRSR